MGIIDSHAPVSVLRSTFLRRSFGISVLRASRVVAWVARTLARAMVFSSDIVEIWVRRLNLRWPRRDEVRMSVQAVDVAWWVSAASGGIGTPTPAYLHGRDMRVLSVGGIPAVGSVSNRAGRK